MRFDLCVLVSEPRRFRVGQRTAAAAAALGQADERRCEGLPLCGVRPMMSEGERAQVFTQAFTYTDTVRGERHSLRSPSRNIQLCDTHPHYS